jgi:hypothetical protein
MPKSKNDILNEVYTHYKEPGNRAIDPETGLGYYRDPSSEKRCAVGLCLDYSKVRSKRLDEFNKGNLDVYDIHKKYGLDEVLKQDYKGHDIEFWAQLQNFHDMDEHFDDKGKVNGKGRQFLTTLLD